MIIKRRIETEEAKQLRDERQHFAAPGGRHDRLIQTLSRALPVAVGIMAALMIITPLSPRGEISFLLDRNKVAVIDERLRVDNAMYRGKDDEGRLFSLTAGEAVQRSSKEGIVRMQNMVAQLDLEDGPARLSARRGAYDIDDELMSVDGPVRLVANDGYRMMIRDVSVNLGTRIMRGDGGVEGVIPAGTFRADRIIVNVDDRTLQLAGNARVRMVPGELRMP